MARYYFRQRFKALFCLLRLDVPFRPFTGLLDTVSGLAKMSRWIARHREAPFNDFYSGKFVYDKRYRLYEYLIKYQGLGEAMDYLEFGVFEGKSFRWWLDHNGDSTSRFWGFDTFTGLPEDWGPFKEGDMSTMDTLPEINDGRAELLKGLFQQTVPDFLTDKHFNRQTVLHLDADLYTSTVFVLTAFAPHLKKGDVILFDEFNVPGHEFRALQDVARSFYWEYDLIGAVNNYCQLAIRLTRV